MDERASATPSVAERVSAADAKLVQARVQVKRAEMAASSSPASDRLRTEIEELEGQVTRLHDAAQFAAPDLLPGLGGEVSPVPADNLPHGLWEVSQTVQARPELIDAEASV